MSGGGILRAPRAGGERFEIVPHARIRDSRLTYRARAVLERLLSNADGFSMTALDLARESPGEGRWVILRALQELRAVGYLVTRKERVERGRWRTVNIVYDTPQQVGLGEATAGVQPPNSGPPDFGDRTPKEVPKEQIQKVEARAFARAREPIVGGGVAGNQLHPKSVPRGSGHYGGIAHGVQVWTAEDRAAMATLLAAHGEDEVEAAAARVANSGAKPFPSRVAAEFQRAAALAAQHAARARADETLIQERARVATRPSGPSPAALVALAECAEALGLGETARRTKQQKDSS